MRNHRKKEKKKHVLGKIFAQTIFVFSIATMSIVLYDMYINIEVDKEETYSAEKLSKEISTINTEDISEILEDVSKSVVRNIKDRQK